MLICWFQVLAMHKAYLLHNNSVSEFPKNIPSRVHYFCLCPKISVGNYFGNDYNTKSEFGVASIVITYHKYKNVLKEGTCTVCQALDVAPDAPHLPVPTICATGTIIIPTVQMKQRGPEKLRNNIP